MANPPWASRLDQLRVFQLDPNLTAILPCHCQARCPFCVEPESKLQAQPSMWLEAFRTLIEDELPEVFRVLTLSGGEPSLSPVFADMLAITARHLESGRLKRVVLTTNGQGESLTKDIDRLARGVTHVNISRHAAEDHANARIFKTKAIPTAGELRDLISALNRRGLPVNLNCVYSAQHLFGEKSHGWDRPRRRAEAKKFISFAKTVGASSVVFRLDHTSATIREASALEEAFSDYATVHEAQCESCSVRGKIIRGLAVNFKQSLFEPTGAHPEGELYELILHSDGRLYRDWSRRLPLDRPLPQTVPTQDWEQLRLKTEGPFQASPEECRRPEATCTLMAPPFRS